MKNLIEDIKKTMPYCVVATEQKRNGDISVLMHSEQTGSYYEIQEKKDWFQKLVKQDPDKAVSVVLTIIENMENNQQY